MQTPGGGALGQKEEERRFRCGDRGFREAPKLLGAGGEQIDLWVLSKHPPISSGSNFICFAYLASPKISDEQRLPGLK